jgi:hypothetical protein
LICAINSEDKLGTKILNDIISYAKNKNYEKIMLDCDENKKKFYEKFGFVEQELNLNKVVIITKVL